VVEVEVVNSGSGGGRGGGGRFGVAKAGSSLQEFVFPTAFYDERVLHFFFSIRVLNISRSVRLIS